MREGAILSVGLVAAVAAGIVSYRIEGPYGRDPRVHRMETPDSLELIAYDVSGNLVPDRFAYLDGDTLVRLEFDENEDGVIERREEYGPAERLQRIGLSSRDDGRIDTWQYVDENEEVTRIEYEGRRDGAITRVEYYRDGAVVGVEERGLTKKGTEP